MTTQRHFLLTAAIALAGCGGVDDQSTSTQPAPTAKTPPAAKSSPADPKVRQRLAAVNQSPQAQPQYRVADTPRNAADDWRRFRGPQGSGVSNAGALPTKWSAREGVAWKCRLPGAGASSPIVVGNRIFVTCYSGYGLSKTNPGNPADLRRHLVCVDRATGKKLWDKPVTFDRRDHGYTGFVQLHGYASSTPVSDGERVYAYFGNWGLYAFDLSGKQLWRFDCGSGSHGFGSGASPVLHGQRVIVNAAVEGQALIAIDKTTGKEAWRSERITDSWSTPTVVKTSGRHEIVLPTRQGIKAFDAETGRARWSYTGKKGTTYTCPSLVQNQGILYGLASYNGPLVAIRPGGSGNVSNSHAIWASPQFSTTVVSPALANGLLFNPHDDGGWMACIDAATGAEKKRSRPRPGWGKLYASPLIAAGKLYVVTRSRGTYVFKATQAMEQIAVNTIAGDDSIFNASPVAHRGQLLLRSDTHLYCIGQTTGGTR